MTQTELGEYMKDIQSEIEDSCPASCIINESTNGYGWWIKISNITNNDKLNIIQVITSRIDMLFDLDLELELVYGWIGDIRFVDWNQMKIDMVRVIDLVDYKNWKSIEIAIGKLQRKIKKFESFSYDKE